LIVNTGYFKPETLEEALDLISRYKEKTKIIAGGTDLLVQMKRGKTTPDYIIDIGHFPGMDRVSFDEKSGLEIGARTQIEEIAASPLIQNKYNILSQAAGHLAVSKIRARATIGGNLCNASPSAETPPALIALDASVKITSVSGQRAVAVEEFFTGPGKTVLKPGELVTAITVPIPVANSSGIYIKHTLRKAMDLAIVGVACLISLDNGIVSHARIALGAVAPTPIRSREAEKILIGNKIDENLINKAAQAASDESKPIDDIRSTATYRKSMVAVLVKRGITIAMEEINLRNKQ